MDPRAEVVPLLTKLVKSLFRTEEDGTKVFWLEIWSEFEIRKTVFLENPTIAHIDLHLRGFFPAKFQLRERYIINDFIHERLTVDENKCLIAQIHDIVSKPDYF